MSGDVFILGIGMVIGALAAWLIVTARIQEAVAKARSEIEAERATLTERLLAKEQQIQSLSASLESGDKRMAGLGEDLRVESERRAKAEERNERIPELESELAQGARQCESLRAENTLLKTAQAQLQTTIEQEQKAAEAKLALLNNAKQELSDKFAAISAEALRINNESFLHLAKSKLETFQEGAKSDLTARQKAIDELIVPLKLSLEKVDVQISAIESKRTDAYATLTEQVRSLLCTEGQLRAETANLVKALRAPQIRGRWGEFQLKRVVELAGMLDHCDFLTQESVTTEDGRLRPDMRIKLHGGRNIVVDAKCPLQAYMDAWEEPDETNRVVHLKRHAAQLRKHIVELGAKNYWEQFDPAPEFVFLFLPGNAFYDAALEQDPELLDMMVQQRVIVATPITLIALLKAVAYGWRQEQVERNRQDISKMGRELYDRLLILAKHFSTIGSSLKAAVQAYNGAVASVEGRFLVTARKFKELGAGSDKEIESLDSIEVTTRTVQAPELLALPSPNEDVTAA